MRYRLLILTATIIWGSTFVLVKDMTGFVNPAWILALRFTSAAILMAVLFAKRRALYFDRAHMAYGALFGVALFAAYYAQTIGITDTTPGKNAFLTATYCVIVPFLAWAVRGPKPNKFNIIAALMCLCGIGLISLNGGFTIGFGDAVTLLCAFFYAVHIVLVGKFAQGRDIYVLTMWQFVSSAACSWIAALLFEPAPTWNAVPSEIWLSLAYLAVMATTVALLFQNIGQANLPSASAALLLSLESVFGVAFSVALGAETLTLRVICGFVLVFIAIIISEVLPECMKAKQE